MAETRLGHVSRPRTLVGFLKAWFGGGEHLWMWDFRSIERELLDAGFEGVRRAHFGDSADPKFGEVEDESRWERCLGVECRKAG